ncbi:PREDICTED: neutral alpha-glucosidase AB-like, partial [Acropora digitifera]|uniref:neutral alpha-glucosidase AB-like n=1 Tax=Acropora digitifera TaxID=70779 RepID=UPI00077A8F88
FHRLNRAIQPGESPYSVLKDSIVFSDSSIDVNILNTKRNVTLKLKVQTLKKNSVRFSINEANPIRERYQVKDVLVQEPETVSYQILKQDDESVHIGFGNNSVVLTNEPFRLDFLVNKEVVVSVNARGLMNFEEYREKRKVPVKVDEGEGHPPGENEEEKPEKEAEEGEGVEKKEEVVEEENWEENFKEHKDTRPRGPCSVGLDISFPGFEHVYGIPEHADSLALKTTVGSEPYRLYNLDVFEYELDSRMALYGSIPVMLAHSVAQTVGVFWMNAAETWVDISSSNARKSMLNSLMSFFKEAEEVPQVETHWISESGIIDVFVMLGPKPHDVFQEYASFTGTTALPPLFGISYHQSRWNYNDEEDVENVDSSFDEHDIPYDVLWLDIEHTDGKKYMTWDKLKFPSPEQMQKNLAAKGRKMVTIIDPHIKREGGYHIHEEATKLGYYVKNKDGGEYDNWCWPGSSSWIDFTNPEIRKWWAGKFALSEYPAAAFMPFYRAHAHLDTKRREPWLFEANYKNIIRNAVRLRYTLLPYWYTLFYHASDTGTPIVRPLWVEFPEEKNTFSMEDEFLLGENLLVKPVTTQGQSTIDVYLPGKDEYWYDLSDYKIYRGESTIYVSTPLEKIPLFQRGGSVIATKQRVRRCSALMHKDPYTLTIALNPKVR